MVFWRVLAGGGVYDVLVGPAMFGGGLRWEGAGRWEGALAGAGAPPGPAIDGVSV